MLAGIAALSPGAAAVLFIDGDGSDRPEMVPAVLAPIERDEADFVLGSRLKGPREPGSLAPAQIAAGYLAGLLIRLRYGPRFTETFRQRARMLLKILRGVKPGDIPVEQPSKFELAVNLKTAKALGISIPATLLARADEVIE